MTEQSSTSIETWAVVEIMGHNRAAGFVKTEPFGGVVMLRVEVPDLPERKREKTGYRDAEGNYTDQLQRFEEILPAEDGYTQWVGMQSIFRLTPCTEETARKAVEAMRREQPRLLHLGPAQEPAALPGAETGEDEASDGGDCELDLEDETESLAD
jgi:hypothetical protein